ncbi:hypothetical protein ACFE04_007425 [Oxalis oulophora]
MNIAITGEVSKREKEAGIAPDPDVDTYMKAISVEGQARNLQTDYVLKILGLDICADVMVGSTLRRGISADQFSQMFRESNLGRQLDEKLSKPYDKSQSDSKSLSFSKHSLGKWQLFKACMAREFLLMKRNSFVYVFKTVQVFSPDISTIPATPIINFNVPFHCSSIPNHDCCYNSSLPPWLGWGFWLSPLTYGEIGLSLNEFTAPRWQKVMTGNTTIGTNILTNHGLNFPIYFYWISVGALLVFTLLFDVGFILALTYLKSPKMKLVISRKKLSQPKEGGNSATCLKSLSALGTNAKNRETVNPNETGREDNLFRLVGSAIKQSNRIL